MQVQVIQVQVQGIEVQGVEWHKWVTHQEEMVWRQVLVKELEGEGELSR